MENDGVNIDLVFICGNCNIGFIETELEYHATSPRVKELHIFTDAPVFSALLKERAKIHYFSHGQASISPFRRLRYLWITFKVFFTEAVKNSKTYRLIGIGPQLIHELRNEVKKAMVVESAKLPSGAVYLSYWASNDALVLAVLAEMGVAKRSYSKLHGYDLYEEFAPHGVIPFRWYQLQQIKTFLPVSTDGENYFAQRYPETRNRLHKFYIGTREKNNALNPVPENGIRVISCGSATPNKRHARILEVMEQIPGSEWYHVGDGDVFHELQALVQQAKNVRVHLLGRQSQQELFDLYRNIGFTCFISLSVTEGVPVSLMEAISCGIPLVATNVGGCREIVTTDTGYLVPSDFSLEAVKEKIMLCAQGEFPTVAGREKVKQFWAENFNAEANFDALLHFLALDKIDNTE